MGKRVYITLAVLAVALVGVIVWQAWPPGEPEPVYQGKPLSSWLKAFATTGTQQARDKADEAVLHVGTNAIPTLLRMLRAKDSALEVKLMDLTKRQHIIKIEHISAGQWNEAGAYGFEALGAEAHGAVPALVEIADQHISRLSQFYTFAALGYIGPPAKEAAPSLLGWATNADARVCVGAMYALARIHEEPNRVVPVLTDALHSTAAVVRMNAVSALQLLGPDAKAAVPALVELFNDSRAEVRENATNALKAIAPEAAAKAGVK
jgi:HEAT repeats/HEAT repeat